MSDDGFLSRWSRRKRAAETGEPAAAAPVPVAAPAPAPVPEEPPFDITTLPPVDSLTIESDFAAFLRKEVPEALKRAALRKAWALDPAIRDFVGPADYAWDYNAPDGVPGGSLNLVGNLREMLTQVFGTGEEAAAEAPAATGPAPAPADGQDDPPATVLLAEAPPPATDAGVPGLAPRKHGSALPS